MAATASAADFRGFVTDGPAGLLAFQPCQAATLSAQPLPLSDKSPDMALSAGVAAVREVMEDSTRPLYVEFDGERLPKGGVAVRRFQRAIGHVQACKAAPHDIGADARLLAKGADPAWLFVLTAAGARFEQPGKPAVRFPASSFAQPVASGKARLFDAWSRADGGSIRLELTEELCRDEASETASGGRVTLRFGSSTFEGCAARF